MQEGFHQGSSKLKLKRRKTDVHGGRVVRSMGRKDRHSKVCTTTGTKERRVRLSPNTAIQFYDLQDRLGYDRPSKALDWLMNKAKSAIDTLDHSDTHNTENFMQSGDHQAYEEGFQDHSQYLPDDSIIISGHEQGLFSVSGSSHLDSDSELAAIPRLFSWNHDSGQFFSQREPLQSSSTRFCGVGSGNEISKFTAEPREVEEKENNSTFMTPFSLYEDLLAISPLPKHDT